jgi:hypothetical protein
LPERNGQKTGSIIAMALWIPVTLSAALFQCWRTAMQQ